MMTLTYSKHVQIPGIMNEVADQYWHTHNPAVFDQSQSPGVLNVI